MWKVDIFEVLFSFVGEGFLGLPVIWHGSIVYLVNVYASCYLDKKREWNNLRDLRRNFQEGSGILEETSMLCVIKGKGKEWVISWSVGKFRISIILSLRWI